MEKVQWNSIDKKQNGLKYSKNDIIHLPVLKFNKSSKIQRKLKNSTQAQKFNASSKIQCKL